MSVAATKRHVAAKMPVGHATRPANRDVATGLCETCGHVSSCSFRRTSAQPVVFCEEFDSGVTVAAADDVQEQVAVVTEEQMKVWDEYKGLCVNCESRENCAIRNAEVGVWHCEEYQ
jgi:hypothetical protein